MSNEAGLALADEYSIAMSAVMSLRNAVCDVSLRSTLLNLAPVKLSRAMITDEKNWFLNATHFTRLSASSLSVSRALRSSTSPPACSLPSL